jgi:hypothetical protein
MFKKVNREENTKNDDGGGGKATDWRIRRELEETE